MGRITEMVTAAETLIEKVDEATKKDGKDREDG